MSHDLILNCSRCGHHMVPHRVEWKCHHCANTTTHITVVTVPAAPNTPKTGSDATPTG